MQCPRGIEKHSPDGGVIRPRYSNTMLFNEKTQAALLRLLRLLRKPPMTTPCNWRNLRGARGTVHILMKMRRSNSHYGGVDRVPAAELLEHVMFSAYRETKATVELTEHTAE